MLLFPVEIMKYGNKNVAAEGNPKLRQQVLAASA